MAYMKVANISTQPHYQSVMWNKYIFLIYYYLRNNIRAYYHVILIILWYNPIISADVNLIYSRALWSGTHLISYRGCGINIILFYLFILFIPELIKFR